MHHWDVIEYVTEEVKRQGHIVTLLDGIERVGWMLNGWSYALERRNDALGKPRMPNVIDAITIGMKVEAVKNLAGTRRQDVWVGDRGCPPFEQIYPALGALWSKIDTMEPLDFYRAFEEIHPFIDGNGRTGKILLNWVNGTLLDPIFPPNDFWGPRIANP